MSGADQTPDRSPFGGDGAEVFEPTADDLLRFVNTTRPEPPREQFVALVRALMKDGVVDLGEVEKLIEAGYTELGGNANEAL